MNAALDFSPLEVWALSSSMPSLGLPELKDPTPEDLMLRGLAIGYLERGTPRDDARLADIFIDAFSFIRYLERDLVN